MFTPGVLLKHDLAQYRYAPLKAAAETPDIPRHLDRREEMLASSYQGGTPQCAAFAMAGCIEWHNWKYKGIKAQVDPAPIYALAKQIDGFPEEEGTTLEAVIRAATQLGLINIDLTSLQVVREPELRHAVHKYGVVLSSFMITSGWRDAKANGWIPDGGDDLGGHAVVVVGFSNLENPTWVAIQNSWGQLSGWNGFARMTTPQCRKEFRYAMVWNLKGA